MSNSTLSQLTTDIEAILFSIVESERLEFKQNNSEILHPGQAIDVHIDGIAIAVMIILFGPFI